MERKHSPYGGSQRERYAACPPSIRISLPYMEENPEPITPVELVRAIAEDRLEKAPARITAAFEGSLGHAVQELVLKGEISLVQVRNKWPQTLSRELLDAVAVSVDFVRHNMQRDSKSRILVEREFRIDDDAWGSCDVVIILPTLGEVHVIDLKLGKGYWVDAQANKQLRFYAVGLWLAGEVQAGKKPGPEWHLWIMQPRYPMEDGTTAREEVLTHQQVLDEAVLLETEIAAAKLGAGEPNPGSWCRWCPGAIACPAQLKLAEEQLANDFLPATLPQDAPALFGVSLGEILRRAEKVEAWIKNLREYAYAEAEKGNPPVGWKLVAKRGMRYWKDGVREILPDALISGLGLPEQAVYKEREVRSVAQIEEQVKLGSLALDREKFAKLFESRSNGYKLVTEESGGEPVRLQDTLKADFGMKDSPTQQLTDEELFALV